jgi:probable HAF family extracellular repeat protein
MTRIRFAPLLLRWMFALSCLLLAATVANARQSRWTIVDLGALGASGSTAAALNDRGDVVGYSFVAGSDHAFLWRNGTMTDLGIPEGDFSTAVGVNDRGTVLVSSGNNDAWLWKDGTWTALGVHSPVDIDRREAVTGMYTVGNSLHSYTFRDGVFRDLGTLGGGDTFVASMNDRGIVVGNSDLPDGSSHGFVYDGGAMKDVGTLGGDDSTATDVNAHGVVVGGAGDATDQFKSFIWDARTGIRALFDLPGFHYATAINDRGAVIGYIDGSAYLFDDGVLTRLEQIPEVAAAGWTQLIAVDINNRGWIAGWGKRGNASFETAFLLIPR